MIETLKELLPLLEKSHGVGTQFIYWYMIEKTLDDIAGFFLVLFLFWGCWKIAKLMIESK